MGIQNFFFCMWFRTMQLVRTWTLHAVYWTIHFLYGVNLFKFDFIFLLHLSHHHLQAILTLPCVRVTICSVNTQYTEVVMRCQVFLWLCCFTLFIVYWIASHIMTIDDALFISVDEFMLEFLILWVLRIWKLSCMTSKWKNRCITEKNSQCIPMFLVWFH